METKKMTQPDGVAGLEVCQAHWSFLDGDILLKGRL